jgi:hypothetical protein
MLNEFQKELKPFTYKRKLRRWIKYFDIETIFKYLIPDSRNTDQSREVLTHLWVNIEVMVKKMGIDELPVKAVKILIKTTKIATKIL